jgi:hypothetical protein
LVSLKPPTELKQYGDAFDSPPLRPVDNRAHSTFAAVLGSVRRTQCSTIPSQVLSRITVLTPSQNTRSPSGETSHVRALSAGLSMCHTAAASGTPTSGSSSAPELSPVGSPDSVDAPPVLGAVGSIAPVVTAAPVESPLDPPGPPCTCAPPQAAMLENARIEGRRRRTPHRRRTPPMCSTPNPESPRVGPPTAILARSPSGAAAAPRGNQRKDPDGRGAHRGPASDAGVRSRRASS